MDDSADNLTADESCVLEYLKHWPGQFVSKIEISRRADSKIRFVTDPNWADRALHSLVESGLVEANSFGQYCLPDHIAAATVKSVPRRCSSPHIWWKFWKRAETKI